MFATVVAAWLAGIGPGILTGAVGLATRIYFDSPSRAGQPAGDVGRSRAPDPLRGLRRRHRHHSRSDARGSPRARSEHRRGAAGNRGAPARRGRARVGARRARKKRTASRTNSWGSCRTSCGRRSTRFSGGSRCCATARCRRSGRSTRSRSSRRTPASRPGSSPTCSISPGASPARFSSIGRRSTSISPCSVVVESSRAAAEARQIGLAMTATEVPLTVWADLERIQQIAGHLLSNAIKFTPHRWSGQRRPSHGRGSGPSSS